jgi:hypothetical protein
MMGVLVTAVRLAPEAAEFYRTQSPVSDPGRYADLCRALPDDPARLADAVRGLVMHRVEGPMFDHDIVEDRLHDDAETRYVEDILGLIMERDGAPLTVRRGAQDRFVGICRDFALLLCSFLRAKGVPARTRCGFADYFGKDGMHGDHVVTEYWDARRGWLLADAQIADGHHGTALDPLDVPRDRFLVAGKAWQLIRAGEADARHFGLFTAEFTLAGYWFVAGNIRLDLSALNKVETLLWDIWGIGTGGDDDMTDEIHDLYDLAARVADDEVVFEAARTLFAENAGLRTPATVLSFAPYNGPREVTLRR